MHNEINKQKVPQFRIKELFDRIIISTRMFWLSWTDRRHSFPPSLLPFSNSLERMDAKIQDTGDLPVSYLPKLSWLCFWLQSQPPTICQCILLSETRSRLIISSIIIPTKPTLNRYPYKHPRQMPNAHRISANHTTNSGWITSVPPPVFKNPSVPPVFCEMLFSIRFHEPFDKLG